MGNKRKRAVRSTAGDADPRRRKHLCVKRPETSSINHPTLKLFYPQVRTLRDWLLAQLPSSSSKSRVRRVALAGIKPYTYQDGFSNALSPTQNVEADVELASLLDSTLICSEHNARAQSVVTKEQDLIEYSQRVSSTRASGIEDYSLQQSDVSSYLFFETIPTKQSKQN